MRTRGDQQPDQQQRQLQPLQAPPRHPLRQLLIPRDKLQPDRVLVKAQDGLEERGHVRWRQLVLVHDTSPTAGCRMLAHPQPTARTRVSATGC
jgi:hypothetical protein